MTYDAAANAKYAFDHRNWFWGSVPEIKYECSDCGSGKKIVFENLI